MKPAPFEYHAPSSASHALELLARHGADARILAGGQSLVPLLNFRLSAPAVIVDLNRTADLAYIKEEGGSLRIGAMTRQRAIEFSALVRSRLPLLAEATRWVGHLPTRTRGTIGGSLAHSDPAAEYPAVVAALDGEIAIRNSGGERVVRAADFFVGFMSTALRPGEMLTEVRLTPPPPDSGWAFEEFSRRRGDFAIVGIAAVVAMERNRCRMARLAVCGAAPCAMRLRGAEEILEAGRIEERSVHNAATRAAELVDPPSDLHASSEYRRHLTRVLTRRALNRALARACRPEAVDA